MSRKDCHCHYCGRRTFSRAENGGWIPPDLVRTVDHKTPKAILTQQAPFMDGPAARLPQQSGPSD